MGSGKTARLYLPEGTASVTATTEVEQLKQGSSKEEKQRAGHQEIQGETIAKFEFFENGYNPYSRYLDVDKVDLILRKRSGDLVEYKEIQVKYGRLYDTGPKWQKALFDVTSWRFFRLDEFSKCNNGLYLAYVLSHPEGYKGDIFIFPVEVFDGLVKSVIRVNTKKGPRSKMYIARAVNSDRWFMWRKSKFDQLNKDNSIEVTKYRRNFKWIG